MVREVIQTEELPLEIHIVADGRRNLQSLLLRRLKNDLS